MTNFESIKEMNIDEMSDFLMDWAMNLLSGDAPTNVKKWLNSETIENTKEKGKTKTLEKKLDNKSKK